MDFVKQGDLDAFISLENVFHVHLHLRKAVTHNVLLKDAQSTI